VIRLTLGLSILAFPAAGQTLYKSSEMAQAKCPNDTVVWLNTRTSVYHFAGERWDGKTEEGAYVCEKQADNAGDRPLENKQ
jgi:hypothetical protein